MFFVICYFLLAIVFGVMFAWRLLEDNPGHMSMPNEVSVVAGLLCGIIFPISIPFYGLYLFACWFTKVLERAKYGE